MNTAIGWPRSSKRGEVGLIGGGEPRVERGAEEVGVDERHDVVETLGDEPAPQQLAR